MSTKSSQHILSEIPPLIISQATCYHQESTHYFCQLSTKKQTRITCHIIKDYGNLPIIHAHTDIT